MKISCGIIIEQSGKILACHPSGRTYEKGNYDIPKGVAEGNEKPIQTVIRELKEETGITSISESQLKDLGEYDYLKDKRLHLFYAKTEGINLDSCKCTSMVEIPDRKPFPEINGYVWKGWDELDWFYPNLTKVIEKVVKDHVL